MAIIKFGAKPPTPASLAPTPIPEPRVPTPEQISSELRRLEAEDTIGTALLDDFGPDPKTIELSDLESEADIQAREQRKLTQLIDDDFPFDDSQLEAIYGITNHRFACMTGAAGTGKTTCTKKVVSLIQDTAGEVDMTSYFKKASAPTAIDPDDDYEIPDHFIPSIALVGFTGRSTQMIKKNFPSDWHGNIMTIHRLLAYYPEGFEKYDEETGQMKNSMRFVPAYHADNLLPWDVLIIDEAGMVGLDLWHNLYAALKPGCRVIMIGDINQLPPVHGRSIFGFALGSWPSWELTHIHRQEGVNNSIVDNAWRTINGQTPVSDIAQPLAIMDKPGIVDSINALLTNDWKFQLIRVPEEAAVASIRIRQFLGVINKRLYDPYRDTVITATNGYDEQRGSQIGQIPLNRELAILFNRDSPRFVIDGGRERKYFAVGDKVMATRNDHEAGITNGMTGIVSSIERNAAYAGDWQRFGDLEEVAKYLSENDMEDDDDPEVDLESLHETLLAQEEGKEQAKEGRDKGPASHIVTVKFGEADHGFELTFDTLAEVASLMTAYVVTCHKMQGGESPLVMTICHQAHKAMLYREWLYTAETRASQKCIIFYTELGLRTALSKQRIKGKTMAEKVKSFQELQKVGIAGASVNVKLQSPEPLENQIVVPAGVKQSTGLMVTQQASVPERTPISPALAKLLEKQRAKLDEPAMVKERIIERTTYVFIEPTAPPEPSVVDGGDLTTRQKEREKEIQFAAGIIGDAFRNSGMKSLPATIVAPESLHDFGVRWSRRLEHPLLLTHQPIDPLRAVLDKHGMQNVSMGPIIESMEIKSEPKKPMGLAALINKGRIARS